VHGTFHQFQQLLLRSRSADDAAHWKARFPAWFLQSERFQTITSIDPDTTQYATQKRGDVSWLL
jgi:hypothetical protein